MSGTTIIGDGQTITGMTLTSGELDVMSGGVASSIIVTGGFELIQSGGVADGATIAGSGVLDLVGGDGTDITINANGVATVASGGTITATVINSGGTVTIQQGSTATGSMIMLGGMEQLGLPGQAGGTSNGALIDGGSQVVFSGGIAMNAFIESGGIQNISGGTAVNTTIGLDGDMLLAGSATVAGIIDFAASNATLTLEGVTNLGTATIHGFDVGGIIDDQIVLQGIASAAGATATFSGNTLTVDAGGQDYNLVFDPSQSFAGESFAVTVNGDSTTLETVCFCAGTRLLTDDGAVVVEALAVGDRLITHRGARAPITWIGRRRLDAARHPKPARIWPIRIAAGAIADGVPARDLLVSPDHALYLDGMLVPAKALVNGGSIAQVRQRHVDYFHVELAEHSVVYAESLPAETYLDTGNRGFFDGRATAAQTLHPDFAQTRRETEGCAPFAESGPAVTTLRQRITARSEPAVTTEDAGLRASSAGSPLRARRLDWTTWQVALPGNGQDINLSSRVMVPAHADPTCDDWRELGLDIAAMDIDGSGIDLADPGLYTGWHDGEAGHRWTSGEAVVPAALLGGAATMTIRLASSPRYRPSRLRSRRRM